MMYSKVITVFLALVGSVAPGITAVGPLAQEVRTETNEPQVVGTAISDGHTVYSVNQCTMFFTTACDISISYGPPVSTETSTSVVLSSTENYPVPTSVVESSAATGSESTPSATATSTSTYPVYTGTETGSYVTGSGTSTATAETGTPTAGGAFHGICQAAPIGAAVMAAVFLV